MAETKRTPVVFARGCEFLTEVVTALKFDRSITSFEMKTDCKSIVSATISFPIMAEDCGELAKVFARYELKPIDEKPKEGD